jgi:general stress protein 26
MEMVTKPQTDLDPRFSESDATPTPWTEAVDRLEKSEIYWISTVRPDGRPHVTPMIGLWLDGALIFTTGESERKAKNLEGNPHVVITTGCNALGEGFDVVVEGEAVRVTDNARLQVIADTYASTYEGWHFDVQDGAFLTEGSTSPALVFEVVPVTAFGFGKGEPYSQTRWRFHD